MWSIFIDERVAALKRFETGTERRHRAATIIGLVACLMGVAASLGCGGGPTAPTDPFAGSWSGVVDDSVLGRGTIQLTLSSEASLSGRWSLLIAASGAAGGITPVPGMATGPDRQFALSCGEPPAGGALVLTASLDGGALQGTYISLGCGTLTRGSVRLARR